MVIGPLDIGIFVNSIYNPTSSNTNNQQRQYQ